MKLAVPSVKHVALALGLAVAALPAAAQSKDIVVTAVEAGASVTTGERVSAREVLAALPEVAVIDEVNKRLAAQTEGERAAAAELALEGLYLAKRVDKHSDEGETVYG